MDRRRIAISADIRSGVSWREFSSSLSGAKVLRDHAIALRPYDERFPKVCAVEGELERFTPQEIEEVASLVVGLVNEHHCVASVSIAPIPLSDGALCWVKPGDEIDPRALRAMLKEYLG